MTALEDEADASFLEGPSLEDILNKDEMDEVRRLARDEVLPHLDSYVDNLRLAWDKEYPPDEHFNQLEKSVEKLCEVLAVDGECDQQPMMNLASAVRSAVYKMEDEYHPSSSSSTSDEPPKIVSSLSDSVFRDVDED